MVFRKQRRQQETSMEPLQSDPQRLSRKAAKNYAQWRRKLQVQARILVPQPKKKDSEALCKRNLKTKITSAKIEKTWWQITIGTLLQPFEYDLRCPAAKDHSLMRAAAAARNLDAATAARENTMFHTPASSPNTRPMQHSCSHFAPLP